MVFARALLFGDGVNMSKRAAKHCAGPFFHGQKRVTGDLLLRGATRGEEGGEDDDDGEEVNRWNLRKCSAAGLDVLSTVFGDELLPIVLPIVEQRLRVRLTPHFRHTPLRPHQQLLHDDKALKMTGNDFQEGQLSGMFSGPGNSI